MTIEITDNCLLLQTFVQSQLDLAGQNGVIIGVTYNHDKGVYDFHMNTDRVASHRSASFPTEDEALKEFLMSIVRTILVILNMRREQNETSE